MAEIKNFKKGTETAKKLAEAAKNPGQALKFWKALRDGSKSKIKNGPAVLMILFAIVLDLSQTIAGIFDAGYLSAPAAVGIQLLIYTIWFGIYGVSYWGKRQLASKIVNTLIEVVGGWIPWVSTVFPACTIMVVMAISIIRTEEAVASSGQSTPGAGEEGDNVVKFGRRGNQEQEARNPEIRTRARKAA